MHFAETFGPDDALPMAKVITFEGEARSGKGTSVRAVQEALIEQGRQVTVIDQGQKFRALARLASEHSVDVTDQTAVTQFLSRPETRPAMLGLLERAAGMTAAELDGFLYTQEMGRASAHVAENANAHPLAVGLLFDQVRTAVHEGTDTILIDGRAMEQYGRRMAEEKLAQFVFGFYFRCDASIAARRTTGIFVDMDKMTVEEKLTLLDAITKISDRNRQDTLRSVDPMLEPFGAYPLHTASFKVDESEYVHQATLDVLMSGMASMDTSYTRNVEEMTRPIVALALHALELHDAEADRFRSNPDLWEGYKTYDDPRQWTAAGV